jgi:hypothetical protein
MATPTLIRVASRIVTRDVPISQSHEPIQMGKHQRPPAGAIGDAEAAIKSDGHQPYGVPRCGKVSVPDRGVFLSPIPELDWVEDFDAGVGFTCPECGDRIWKDNHLLDWRPFSPTGLRPR